MTEPHTSSMEMQYCPFDALGIAHKESAHSNFLGNILNPKQPHGFGNTVLKAFIHNILSKTGQLEKFAEITDWDSVHVVRESIYDIDLVIIFKNIVFVLELKIHAPQGPDQLRDYRSYIFDNYSQRDCVFIYLTLRHDKPRDERFWNNVLLCDAIEKISDIPNRTPENAFACSILDKYAVMIKRIGSNLAELNDLHHYIYLMSIDKTLGSDMSIAGMTLEYDSTNNSNVVRHAIREWYEILPAARWHWPGPEWDGYKVQRLLLLEQEINRRTGKINITLKMVRGKSDAKTKVINFLSDHGFQINDSGSNFPTVVSSDSVVGGFANFEKLEDAERCYQLTRHQIVHSVRSYLRDRVFQLAKVIETFTV